MVALDFCDDDYKQNTLNIPEEFSGRMVIKLCLSIEIAKAKDEKFFICDSM